MTARPLSDALAAAASRSDERSDALEAAFVEALAAARTSLPEVTAEDLVFARYLGARVSDGEPLIEALKNLRITDLYLACACAEQDPAALRMLDAMLRGEPLRASARVTSEDTADEAVQVLRERLLVHPSNGRAKIEDYLGRGPLIGWLCASAVRTALTLRRVSDREVPSEDPVLELEMELPEDSADLRLMRERFRVEFAAAFRASVAALDSRSRNVLRMHVLDGLNIDQIGAVYGVHRATVARWIARAREAILLGTRGRIAEKLGIVDTELDSLFRLVDGQLDLSLTSLLR